MYKLGRNRPIAPAPKLRLGNYMLHAFPTPPDAVDYTKQGTSFLRDILGNDQNGDCTCATAFHIHGCIIANAGDPLPPDFNVTNTLKMYYLLSGGEDSGLDEQTVFNYWQATGLSAGGLHKIVGKVRVDPTNEDEVKAALWLFENLYITSELPDAWVNSMPQADGFTWAIAGPPNPENGHAFCGLAYAQGGVTIDTWGLFGTQPMSSLAFYSKASNGGGLYSVLTQDIINRATSRAPNGFDWAKLQANLAMFQP